MFILLSDLHVLQWIHGCEVDTSASEVKFLHGIDMYSYDGANFLSFDEANENWVAPNDAARQTKAKWDDIQVLKEYTKSYLKNECVRWLERFLEYQKKGGAAGTYGDERTSLGSDPRLTSPRFCLPVQPDVYVFSRAANVQTNILLTCMATGFSSINTIIRIKRDGRVLTKEDGVQSSGVRPNGDGTFQQRDHVEIPKSDESNYTCEVIHESSGLHVEQLWGKTLVPFLVTTTPAGTSLRSAGPCLGSSPDRPSKQARKKQHSHSSVLPLARAHMCTHVHVPFKHTSGGGRRGPRDVQALLV